MSLRRAILTVVCLGPLAIGTAAAQWPAPQAAAPAQQQGSVWDRAPQQPAQQQGSVWDRAPQQPAQPAIAPANAPPAANAAPGASPWNRPQPQQPPPCVVEFVKLREATEKRASAIRAASERKAQPKEVCGLFNAFTAAESKLIKYATENQQACGIPAQIIDQMKKGHGQSTGIRAQVCKVAAAGPPRPAAPSLSDALSAPVPSANNIKTGRGTFDTLTGSPLGR
jgi:hypothetical protein